MYQFNLDNGGLRVYDCHPHPDRRPLDGTARHTAFVAIVAAIREYDPDAIDGSPAGGDVLARLRDDFVDALASSYSFRVIAPDAANDIATQLVDALAKNGR